MKKPQDSSNPGARSRFVREPHREIALGTRDEELLCTLFLHQALSRGQIQTLYFGSVPRCNARLRQLYDHRYVRRYYLPRAPYGSQAIYLLGQAAIPVVAACLERSPAEVRSLCRQETPTFLEHTLAITDFYLALRSAVEQQDIQIERWLPEMLCRHEYEMRAQGAGWHKEVFKPDGFVRLACGQPAAYHSFFVEIDLGHTASGQFLGKLEGHRRYLQSGLFAETFGCDRFATLVVTTGEVRRDHLCALAQSRGTDLFWFTTFAAVQEQGALEAIWQIPGAPGRARLW